MSKENEKTPEKTSEQNSPPTDDRPPRTFQRDDRPPNKK